MATVARRTAFAYDVINARCPDYNLRAADVRFCWLALLSAAVIIGGGAWWSWIPIINGVIAGVLARRISQHDMEMTDARAPGVRWAQNVTRAAAGTSKWNVPGALEFFSAISIVWVGPWAMADASPTWRLVAVAAAVGYCWNFLSGVLLDPFFYNPRETSSTVVELSRSIAGVLAAVYGVTVTATAPWPAGFLPVATGCVAVIVSLQLRIRETDRLLVFAERESGKRAAQSRQDITEPTHGILGTSINSLYGLVEDRKDQDPELFDEVSLVLGQYRMIMELESNIGRVITWPGVLVGPLVYVLSPANIQMPTPNLPEEPIPDEHRRIALAVLFNVAANARNSGARYTEFSLAEENGTYVVTAFDDGEPLDPRAWMRKGGGLDRLRRRYDGHNFETSYDENVTNAESRSGRGKVIRVRWRAN